MDSVSNSGLSDVSIDYYEILLLRESQLFHSGHLPVLLIYTLNAALAWFALQVTKEPGFLKQECHTYFPSVWCCFLGKNWAVASPGKSSEWPLELLLLIISTVCIYLNGEWEHTGPGEN